jgi:lipoprotein NlpI
LDHPLTKLEIRRTVIAIGLVLALSSCAGNGAKQPAPYDDTLAVAAMQQRDYGGAIRLWASVLNLPSLTPVERARAYAGRAMSYLRQDDVELALADASAAVALQPDQSQWHGLRGAIYLSKRDPANALADFDVALKLKADFIEAHAGRGEAHMLRGEFEPAIAEFDAAIAVKPYLAEFYADRGRAYLLAGQSERAMQDFNEAVQRDPRAALAYKARWIGLYQAGRFPAAAADLQQSLALDPDQPYVALWLHVTRLRMKIADGDEFARNADKLSQKTWPRPIVDFYQGRVTSDQLLEATADADPDKKKAKTCEADFYLAQSLVGPRKSDEAKRMLLSIQQTCPVDFVEYQLTKSQLRGM